MMRFGLILSALLLSTSAVMAGDDGLHNDSKQFTPPHEMQKSDWSDPAEMQRTWQRAIVRVPTGSNASLALSTSDLANWDTPERFPAVVYLHGCSGIWSGTHQRVQFMAENGFVAVAPASMARVKYPQSCDAQTHQGGMYRPTLKMRQYDAAYAIEQLRALPFVDPDRIVLMGLSQGGWATTTYQAATEAQQAAARVAEGITCHAGWREYVGINAREDEPILTLVAAGDPWYQNPWTRGDCTEFIDTTNGSRSVVYDTGTLADVHELLDHEVPRQEVLTFLNSVLER